MFSDVGVLHDLVRHRRRLINMIMNIPFEIEIVPKSNVFIKTVPCGHVAKGLFINNDPYIDSKICNLNISSRRAV